MERHFDEQLDALKLQLTKMSALAETMIADAVRVLVDRDEAAAATVYAHEEQVNRMQVAIDEMCLTLIALHQPAARDLRFILGAVKTNSDLERLADQAVNICNKAERLLREPPLRPFVILPRMAEIARGMLKDSLHAYVSLDLERAQKVLLRDDEVDQLKAQITTEMTDLMARDPATVRRAVDILLVARNLERIGDHATNIAENAIFVAEGRDVRHHFEEKPGIRP
jgi:phosphate transport system protein